MKARVLRDLVELHRGTTYKSALLDRPGPVLLGLASIQRNGGFRSDSLRTYGGESPDKLLLRPGDLYVSLKDVTQAADLLGAVSRVPVNVPLGRLTQDTVKLVFKTSAVPSAYVYWLLRTPEYRSYCRGRATGTTNLGLPREDFLSFEIPEPNAARLHIISLLELTEQKLELNRSINQTLEAMARTIFKSWFVDFDPVRAKAATWGQRLPQPVLELFPDSFESSSLGRVPMGWRVTSWGKLVTLEYGKSLSEYDDDGKPFPVYGTNGKIGTHSQPLCSHPGIIIGRKGAYRGVHFCDSPFFVIDTAFYIEPKVPVELRWAYYSLLRHDINAMDSGSAIPSTSRDDFYAIPVLAPPLDIQRKFTTILQPMWDRQVHNARENEVLTTLRDTLLPKLLSGEARIKHVQKALESVI